MDLQLKHLPRETQDKLRRYRSILKQAVNDSFWDIIVLSSGDEEQRRSYEQQIALKKSRKEIPAFVKYVVTSDPPGAKIGNGGATMHVLEQLQEEVSPEELAKAKVMVIHAGGYSQRLPSVSVIGKAFMALPCGGTGGLYQMLDALMIMYVDFPAKMNPGVFITASDVLFLYNGSGDWDMKQAGITAIAHPADIEVATTHGVFVLQNIQEVATKYAGDPDHPSMMGKAKRFLHKASSKTLESSGSQIPGSNQVFVDLAYYVDWPTTEKLVKFYSEHKPLSCEIDAYGDFLQALGPEATSDYCSNTANVTFVTEDLVTIRREVYEVLRGTPLNVAIFNQAQFNHVGTTAEYLHHLFSNVTLSQSLGFQAETMVAESTADSETAVKRVKRSFEGRAIMHTILRDRASVSVGEESVVEYCILEADVSIGKKCIVSNLHLPRGVAVPDGSFLHTIPLSKDGRTCYATFAFDICDSMKTSVSKGSAHKLQYCNTKMAEAVKVLFDGTSLEQILPEDSPKFCLWNSKLFPIFSSREDSAKHAVDMLHRLKQLEMSPLPSSSSDCLVCVADMLQLKSIATILEYHSVLREEIHSSS